MAEILSNDYRDEQAALVADPIIRAMAYPMTLSLICEYFHADGTPRFEFMQMANAEYRSRGGDKSQTLGAVARALKTVLEES